MIRRIINLLVHVDLFFRGGGKSGNSGFRCTELPSLEALKELALESTTIVSNAGDDRGSPTRFLFRKRRFLFLADEFGIARATSAIICASGLDMGYSAVRLVLRVVFLSVLSISISGDRIGISLANSATSLSGDMSPSKLKGNDVPGVLCSMLSGASTNISSTDGLLGGSCRVLE